jgi:DNA-binding Lrp family transcriptional regulator
MSVAESIKSKVLRMQKGDPFVTNRFLNLGSRPAVDKAISRLVEEGVIERVARGVRFVGKVMPDVSRVVEVIAKGHGETIQVHGAEAARRFKISTQMPIKPVYYTNGPSREIQVGNLKVKLVHTSSQRKLQFAGKKAGLALTALWYLGKEQVNSEAIRLIREGLSESEYEQFLSASKPLWMNQAIQFFNE